MKSGRHESFKTCTTSSSLISIPSNNNKWKVQTYFYVTISVLVNSYILEMLFDTFPTNARTQNPRQCETTGKTATSYHKHIPNVSDIPPQITRRSDVGIKLAWLLSSMVSWVAQSVQRLNMSWTVRDRIPVGTRFSARPDWPSGPPSLL